MRTRTPSSPPRPLTPPTWHSILLVALVLAVLVAPSPAVAAGSGWGSLIDDLMPTVQINLTHPPRLDLVIDKVAFEQGNGRCIGAFTSSLMGRFIDNGVEVVERDRLDQLLAEHDLSISGFVDPDDAIAIGKLLGPSALIFVSEQRCSADKSTTYKDFKDSEGRRIRVYYAKTEVSFSASIQIVELETGRVFTAKTFEATRSDVAEGRNSRPSYPPEYGPQGRAIDWAVELAHRMFFPWSETKELRFFKDKKCDLVLAYRMLQINDVEGAVAQSEQNLEQCEKNPKTKPKTLARAHYNLGMSRFLLDDHQGALEHLEQAHRIRPGPRIREAILECQKAEKEWREMRQYESRIAAGAAPPPPPVLAEHEPLDAMPTAAEGSAAEQGRDLPKGRSVAERLEELEALFEKGLIDQTTYQTKRLEILEDL